MNNEIIERRCDKCREFKKTTFSFFTERQWICDDCQHENVMFSMMKKMGFIIDNKVNIFVDIDIIPNMVTWPGAQNICPSANPVSPDDIKNNLKIIKKFAMKIELDLCKNITEILDVLIRYNK